MPRHQIPASALISIQQRLALLPARCLERKLLIEEAANLYRISTATLYRLLRAQSRPKSIRCADKGQPRKLSPSEMENYCEVIAAFKIRTSNKQGRHISTTRAIELLEKYGVETPSGLVQPEPGVPLRLWRECGSCPAVSIQRYDSQD